MREEETRISWQKLIKKENIIFVILVIIGGVFILRFFFKNHSVQDEVEILPVSQSTSSESTKNEEEKTTKMYVDIKGAVNLPGMYEVTSDMRVLNVIDLAGGLNQEADDQQINFSARVEDQMIIYVPKKGEQLSEVILPEGNKTTGEGASMNEADSKINLNNATKEELMTLNGVGEKKAEKIIEYREENGSFKSIEDLKNVNGFGEKTFESLKAYITM